MSNHENPIDTKRASRNAAWRWGSIVVGLLSLQVALGVAAIMLATGDESVAVIPNYHEKALNWDKEVALRTASKELGWVAQIDQTEGTSTAGLQLRLRDRNGQLVQIESGTLEIYRHARANDTKRIELPSAEVALTMDDCFDAEGHWQVSLDVLDVDGNRFVDSQQLFVDFSTNDQEHGDS